MRYLAYDFDDYGFLVEELPILRPYKPDSLDPQEFALLVAGIETEKPCQSCFGRGFRAIQHGMETCGICEGSGVVPI